MSTVHFYQECFGRLRCNGPRTEVNIAFQEMSSWQGQPAKLWQMSQPRKWSNCDRVWQQKTEGVVRIQQVDWAAGRGGHILTAGVGTDGRGADKQQVGRSVGRETGVGTWGNGGAAAGGTGWGYVQREGSRLETMGQEKQPRALWPFLAVHAVWENVEGTGAKVQSVLPGYWSVLKENSLGWMKLYSPQKKLLQIYFSFCDFQSAKEGHKG